MSKFNGSVQISKDLYYRLATRELELDLLEGAGVDNWAGMDCVEWKELDDFKKTLYKALHESNSFIDLRDKNTITEGEE